MIDRIEAWLRMRDTARFRADAEKAAAGIRRIGEAADRADKKLKKLRLTSAGQASVFHTLMRNINSMSGRLKIAAALITIFGPDLISLAASATSAAMGIGLLGATAGGAAAIGLAGFGLVLGQTLSGLDEIRSAQEAYTLAVAQHGKWSNEAVRAQERLNAVIGTQGGAAVLGLLDSWDQLKKGFAGRTGAARANALGFLMDTIETAQKIMPTFARETNRNVASIRKGMAGALGGFASREGLAGIRTLSRTFRGMFGPLVQGGADTLIGLFAYMRQAGPWVVSIAESFASWAKSFRESARNGTMVNDRVSGLIGHLRVWWGLAGALGGLMKQLWDDSNQSGGRLIRRLTGVVEKFTEWIDAGEGTDFFQRWGELTAKVGGALVLLLGVIGQLVNAAFPGMMSGADGLQVVFGLMLLKLQVLTHVIQFLGPLVGPLIVGFYALRVATLAWAAATTILGIAMRLTPLGWIVTGIGLIIAAIILIANHMGGFGKLWDAIWGGIKAAFWAAFNFIKKHWSTILMILTGPPGIAIGLIVKNFEAIKGAFKAILNWIYEKWNNFSIGMPPIKVAGHTVIPGFKFETPDIALLGDGGDILPGGLAIVGERGPELAQNQGGRTRITPLAKTPGSGASLAGAIHIKMENVVVLSNGREIARSTAEQTAEWNARKGK